MAASMLFLESQSFHMILQTSKYKVSLIYTHWTIPRVLLAVICSRLRLVSERNSILSTSHRENFFWYKADFWKPGAYDPTNIGAIDEFKFRDGVYPLEGGLNLLRYLVLYIFTRTAHALSAEHNVKHSTDKK